MSSSGIYHGISLDFSLFHLSRNFFRHFSRNSFNYPWNFFHNSFPNSSIGASCVFFEDFSCDFFKDSSVLWRISLGLFFFLSSPQGIPPVIISLIPSEGNFSGIPLWILTGIPSLVSLWASYSFLQGFLGYFHGLLPRFHQKFLKDSSWFLPGFHNIF